MAKINAANERIKRDYLRFLKEAKGKSGATLDMVRKALARFEESTSAKDFKTFRREQAIAFKERLGETEAIRTGAALSAATRTATLTAVREFFIWLAWRPGFKSRLQLDDVEYLNPSRKDAATAKAPKLRDYPSLEQIRTAIAAMPTETVVDRCNRALIAFTILTGMRDKAIVSLSLRHVDIARVPPVVRQDPNSVETKFAKAITTYFFQLGDDLDTIVRAWIGELRNVHLFGPTDPLFPRTKIAQGEGWSFAVSGIKRAHWSNASPVREIFRRAFSGASLPYFSPHTFRHTLGHLAQEICRTPEELKAWSQNLGHENLATTLNSYGKIDAHRQGEVIAGIAVNAEQTDNLAAEIGALLARHGERKRI
ncbi:site-specific integrase [Mesorhizobium sp. BR1-1-16]|uniref:tyrosine-type recombinase/integrase n=1 Tax=Mesorhizobium sp. BR1-1-16 TaxID=2876653 RepID=UPI001CCA6E08|nr:site-specific integrase [Mesorhizobium sp. BR1-1-16]MBZ9939469.1 site-specific integrase [Mesorhizobium sp. BR1-1-16]